MDITLAVLGMILVSIPIEITILKLIGSALIVIGTGMLGYGWDVALVISGIATGAGAYVMNKFTDEWVLSNGLALAIGVIEVIVGFVIAVVSN